MEWVRTLIVQAEWLPLTRKTSIVWLKVPPLGGMGVKKLSRTEDPKKAGPSEFFNSDLEPWCSLLRSGTHIGGLT